MKIKGISIAVFTALSLSMNAQVSYKATITALPQSKTIEIFDISDQKSHESATVQNGKATISGTKPDQTILMLVDRENSLFGSLVVDGSEVSITLKAGGYEVNGSDLNETLALVQNDLAAAQNDDAKEIQIMHDAFYSNRDNIIGAFIFANGYMYQMKYEDLKAEVESDAPYLKFSFCDRAKQYIKGLALRKMRI